MLAQVCAEENLVAQGPVQAFADEAAISKWAVQSVQAVAALGLMKGMEDGTFAPQDAALREQAIVVLQRLRQLMKIH